MKVIIVQFRKYCDITPLHGFSFVNQAERRLIEAALWLLIIAVCIGLAVRDTISLVTLYLSQPTATTISLQANATMQYPTPVVCLEIDRFAFALSNAHLNAGIAPYDPATFNTTLATFPWNLIAAATSSASMASICPQATFTNCVLSETVMNVAYMMFTAFADYDQNIFGPMVNGAYNPNTVTLIDTLLASAQANGVNLYTFARVVSGYFCYRMLFTATYYEFNPSSDQYTSKLVDPCGNLNAQTWLGGQTVENANDAVCFEIVVPNSTPLFAGPTDYLTISADLEANIYGGGVYPAWATSTLNLNFDLRNGDGVIDSTSADSDFITLSKCQGQVGVGVASVFVAYNKTASPCLAVSQYVCTKLCNSAWILANRRCNSFLYSGAVYAPDTTKPGCTTHFTIGAAQAYLATANGGTDPMANSRNNNFATCNANCPPPCTNTIYGYTTSWENQCNAPPTTITVYPATFVYPVFSETLTMDLLGFFYSFGGSIGLWLGGSLIAFVHIPIYVVAAICEQIRLARLRRTNPMYEGNASDEAGVVPPQPT